jgi:hypothetical protein
MSEKTLVFQRTTGEVLERHLSSQVVASVRHAAKCYPAVSFPHGAWKASMNFCSPIRYLTVIGLHIAPV